MVLDKIVTVCNPAYQWTMAGPAFKLNSILHTLLVEIRYIYLPNIAYVCFIVGLNSSVFVCLLQDCLCPEKLLCFWSSPPGCLWLAHSILHLFSPLFWGTSAWCACQHILSTLHCSSPTWNEGEQLKEWRKRLDRNCHSWNPTPSSRTGSEQQIQSHRFSALFTTVKTFQRTTTGCHEDLKHYF